MSLPILAYGSTPKEAGTFTLYRALRAGLLAEGFDLRCVAVGAQQAALWDDAFADEGCLRVGQELIDLQDQARSFARWSVEAGVRFVMPLNSPALRAALPHLPSDIRLLPRCADSVDFGYQRTLTCRERIAAIVATTPRHVRDLTDRYGVARDQITLIPHGISAAPFDDAVRLRSARTSADDPLRLAFLGRLEHRQKGVMFLPEILRKLEEQGVNWTLSVAGQGEHEGELRAALECAGVAQRVRFTGVLRPPDTVRFLVDHDLLLFPSQHEGFGFVLIEALMAGCVPVASRLAGVTDFIVREGQTGLLCEVGDTSAFAQAVLDLAADAGRVDRFAKAARADARARFTNEQAVGAYAALLHDWNRRPAPVFEPRSWASFRLPADLRDRGVRRWFRTLKRQVIGVRV